MLLRFHDVAKDVVSLEETGFLSRDNAPRVTELIGRQAAVEAAFKRTSGKLVQTSLQGQSRALSGAIVFSGSEADDDAVLSRLAERWEADFLAEYSRHEHYEILWHHLNWGAGHELRFFVPLFNKVEQSLIPAPKSLIDRADLWTRVQALTFGLPDPLPRLRAGMRPAFHLSERGANKNLRPALTAYVEEAVMADELQSRKAVIADLGKIGFEVAREDSQALTVKYVGADPELAAKARRPVVLTGPVFSEGFGRVDDPKLLKIEEAVRSGRKKIQEEAKTQADMVAPAIGRVVEDAIKMRVDRALQQAEAGLDERMSKFKTAAENVVKVQQLEIQYSAEKNQKGVENFRKEINESLTNFTKLAGERKDALLKDTDRDLTAAVESVKVFRRDVDGLTEKIDLVIEKKDAQIRKLTWGLVVTGVVALMLLVPTLYFSIGGAKMVADVRAAIERLEVLGTTTERDLAENRASLSRSATLQGQVQEALRGFAESFVSLGNGVAIERKMNGQEVMTLYPRRLPSVSSCERDPGCVVRMDYE
jgi:antitoxin component of RelBE/YafQ-DinJ toxin-antitoxin module